MCPGTSCVWRGLRGVSVQIPRTEGGDRAPLPPPCFVEDWRSTNAVTQLEALLEEAGVRVRRTGTEGVWARVKLCKGRAGWRTVACERCDDCFCASGLGCEGRSVRKAGHECVELGVGGGGIYQ